MDALLDVLARLIPYHLERTLDTVVDRAEQARTQLDREGYPGAVDVGAGREPGRILVDLDRRTGTLELHDLADEVIIAHLDEIEHLRPIDLPRMDDRTDNLIHFPDDLKHYLSPRSPSKRKPPRR